eukprot:4604520-Pyramimonas_sp.AAC.1
MASFLASTTVSTSFHNRILEFARRGATFHAGFKATDRARADQPAHVERLTKKRAAGMRGEEPADPAGAPIPITPPSGGSQA